MLDTPPPENNPDMETLRASGRKLEDFDLRQSTQISNLHPAESDLLKHAVTGKPFKIADLRPDEMTSANRVRASFIRFLTLGADDDIFIHENGVQLQGAFVEGTLDLDYVRCKSPLRLKHCRFENSIIGRGTQFITLALDGSFCHGVTFDDANFEASVSMIDGFRCEGTVRLTGATIGGDLDMAGAQLINPQGDALACRGIHVERTVFLTAGFMADGRVRFSNAQIGGDFSCYGGSFIQRRPTRQSDPKETPYADYALSLTNAKIGAVLWLGPWTPPYDKQVNMQGSINLQGAHAATLADHEESWPPLKIKTNDGKKLPCVISLDGFTYERLAARSPTQASKRSKWLMRQRPRQGTGGFRPQPFEQLISVLRNMGLEQDARQIGLLKEQRLQTIRFYRASFWAKPFIAFNGFFWGGFCGYGYRPHRLFVSLFALWVAASVVFYQAEQAGGFAPRDPEIWTKEEVVKRCGTDRWTACEEVARLLPFNAVTYAADTILPVIDLQQSSNWAPSFKAIEIYIPFLGKRTMHPGALYVFTWIMNLLGATAVILLGAIMSGLVKRD